MKIRYPNVTATIGVELSAHVSTARNYSSYFILTILFSAIACTAFAEGDSVKANAKGVFYGKNSIILSGTDFTLFLPLYFQRRGILGPLLFWRDEQIGIYYNRKVSKKWSVTLGYNMWNSTRLYYQSPAQVMTAQSSEIKVGYAISSTGYKMGDAFINYRIYPLSHQQIKIGLGISYTQGINEIVDSIVAQPGYFDAEIFTHGNKASYWGIVPHLTYDYLFLRDRMSIGFDIRYRRYFDFYFKGLESGVHFAINF